MVLGLGMQHLGHGHNEVLKNDNLGWPWPFLQKKSMPASVAQLDARPTGDQVAGSTPAEVSNILS